MPSKTRIPSYRLHRASGCAVVTLNGQDHYLGAFNSPDSRSEYRRVISEWIARAQISSAGENRSDLAVVEVVLAYLRFADTYYRDSQGQPTLEVSFRVLRAQSCAAIG